MVNVDDLDQTLVLFFLIILSIINRFSFVLEKLAAQSQKTRENLTRHILPYVVLPFRVR